MEKGWTCRSPRSFPLRRDHEANLPGERAHSSNPPALRRRPTSRGRVSDGDDPWGRRREKSPRAGNDGSSTASGRSENNISWARPPRLRPRLRLQVEPPNCLPSLSRQGGVCVSVQARDLPVRERARPTRTCTRFWRVRTGVWDVTSNDDVGEFVARRGLGTTNSCGETCVARVGDQLLTACLKAGLRDNL